jgi:outer membrane protein assembly factor BamB
MKIALLFGVWLTFLALSDSGLAQATVARPFKLKWFFESGDLINIRPAVQGGTIFLPLQGGVIISLRTSDGEFTWRSEIGGRISALPFADDTAVFIASENLSSLRKTSMTSEGALRALSRQSGVTLWSRMFTSPFQGEILSKDNLLFGSLRDGRTYAIKREAGETVWVKAFSAPVSPLVTGKNHLYVGDSEGNLFALEQKTGRTSWRYRTRSAIKSPVTAFGGLIYAASTDGYIYAVEELTGRLRWRARTNAAVQSLVATDKCLLATSLDNFIYCISPQGGSKIWKRPLGGRVIANPLVIGDGVLISPLVGDECIVLSLRDGKKINSIYVGEDNNGEAGPFASDGLLFLPTRKGLYAYTDEK